MATLFSYFTKVPANKSPNAGDRPETNDKTSPKGKAKTPETKKEVKTSTKANDSHVFVQKICDVVWAKMEGHPIWPAIVCNHPKLNIHARSNEYHVQFFGEPPSRGWVKKTLIQPFVKGENKGGHSLAIRAAVEQAEKALALSSTEREGLICCIPSDEESEAEMERNGSASQENDSGDGSTDDEVNTAMQKNKRPRRKAAVGGMKKRKRVMIESDSDGSDDFKPESEESDDSVSSGAEEEEPSSDNNSEEDEEEEETKNTKKRKRGSTSTPSSKKGKLAPNMTSNPTSNTPKPAKLSSSLATKITNSASKAATSLARFQMTSSPAPVTEPDENGNTGVYLHEKLDWLKEGKRKDKHGRPMLHPDYDPKTLLVPQSYLTSKDVTPAMRQWWQLKSEHFDTVLFFKVGKFYELYHMDATTGVKELNLIYMKGNFAHAGFPEIAFGRYSDTLIQKGYKIARVEQTETPEMMKERCKKNRTNSKFDQVVKREICAVTTKGTKMYSFRDGDCTESEAAYLLAVAEKELSDCGGESMYGVCFLDTSIGKFHIGQFKDDRQASRLRTLIAHHPPVQVLTCRGSYTSKTQHILSHELMSSLTEHLAPGSEFWDASKTLKFLAEGNYFKNDKDGADESVNWPAMLKMMTDGDPLGLTPTDGHELALSALGAVAWYLKKCLIEEELLSMGKFEEYKPLDCLDAPRSSTLSFTQGRQHLILDDVTLTNLDVVPCGPDGSLQGTLLEQLDHCSTPFGKRLFKQWLCAPLCNPMAINDRLDAIEDLMTVPAVVCDVKEILKTLPDLERLLRKIHSLGSVRKATDHPDGRAILYNEETYSKRKIADFLSVLEGLKSTVRIVKLFKDHVSEFKSKLLKQIITQDAQGDKSSNGRFPHMESELKTFQGAFDHEKAKKDGIILPKPGVQADYDQALEDITSCKEWFMKFLDKQRNRLGCKTMCYWGSAKNRYQLEIPESALGRNTPDEYTLQSQKKGFRRFWTTEIEEKLAELTEAEERRDAALKDTMRNLFHRFDEHYDMWDQAVQCLSVLDALLSLMTYSSHGDGTMCRPDVILPDMTPEGNHTPFIEIRDGRHPCIARTFTGDDFIPNDTVIGIGNKADESESAANAHSTCVLVTGPNMGGKSTLMRQVGLITIMAQLGCYVPAELCRLTPVDRVFTRLGAHDRILAGESTFFVELSETATILRHSTRDSLVLLDELGRGTATYDGTAIACAVVRELSANVRCRTLFSTHYHSLVEEFATDPNVRLGHMACMVENEDEEGDPSKETITFLYKFVRGDCPKSYGFNAARLAGIPGQIITVAVQKSRKFEETMDQVKMFREILTHTQRVTIKKRLLSLKEKIKL
ncbi:DNA mismatch repair protein Msh6-like [Nematostella vectensis]|uniref:DNA mismatch repair protein Msh6-like n=1 Tax=Nematostella vectensis TaxID=45351 RepID=UPI002076FFED|nr:DNA mismatch repair protein Msh6-like [Nematostella vectensis]